MTRRPKLDRAISEAELGTLKAAFAVGSKLEHHEHLLSDAEKLWVVSKCACGCDTVEFRRTDNDARVTDIASALGTTPGGGTVGIIVFGTEREIESLEVFDMGVVEDGIRLPVLASIRSPDYGSGAVGAEA